MRGKIRKQIEKAIEICYTDGVFKVDYGLGRMKRTMKRGKRKTAWLLSAVMFLSVLFSGNVYAADDTNTDSSQNNVNVEAEQNAGNENGAIPEENSDIETQGNPDDTAQSEQAETAGDTDQTVQDSSAPNQTETGEDVVPAEQGLLNYVGVDYPYLETPADQNIVISYGDGSEDVSDARLVVQKDDGNTLEMSLSKKEGELFLFTYSFDETASGVYELIDFVYTQDGTEETIHLADIGIESMFGVNEEYPGYGETSEESSEEVTAQELEMSVVDVETGEVEAATTDIEKAIEATEEQVGAAQANRASRATVASRSDDFVVVLDPGHGGYDGGASANGLVEKNLNLKIAEYCKEELEQYDGVTVYMTRTNNDTYLDIDERVDLAANHFHADVLVSIHINSSTASGANGAEVWYPNENYNASVHVEGKNLAQLIQNQLIALGLSDRGIDIRSTVNDTYPDGSKEDWYGIIRYSKYCGFPGIIVEHAFISNPSDAAKLSQESFLKQLGIADATGIANAYGLKKHVNSIKVKNANDFNGSFQVEVDTYFDNISEVTVEVENEDAATEKKTYALEKVGEGEYLTTIKKEDFNGSVGKYRISGLINYGGSRFEFEPIEYTMMDPYVSMDAHFSDDMKQIIIETDIENQPLSLENISVVVWGDTGGQNDLVWYTLNEETEGIWTRSVNIADHKEAGNYQIHVYANIKDGEAVFLGNRQLFVEAGSMEISLGAYNAEQGTFEITARNVTAASGVKNVSFPVWETSDKDGTTYWYEGERQADGSYKAVVNVQNHNYKTGIYHVQGYVEGENGVLGCTDGSDIEITEVVIKDLYPIMGKSSVFVLQMVNYFNVNNGNYPSEALGGRGGAETIEDFCRIAYEEAESEGVKAEVLFAQMMHETGFLRFGGDVKIEQFNFGGLGAVGNGEPGNSFPSVRIGIRAQVQHLKCYACDQPLNNENVDPRWWTGLRNKAPYVQWLSIPNNPYGTGWASDPNYGAALLEGISRIKSM